MRQHNGMNFVKLSAIWAFHYLQFFLSSPGYCYDKTVNCIANASFKLFFFTGNNSSAAYPIYNLWSSIACIWDSRLMWRYIDFFLIYRHSRHGRTLLHWSYYARLKNKTWHSFMHKFCRSGVTKIEKLSQRSGLSYWGQW